MKLRLEFTVELTELHRKAINSTFGKVGLASREECKYWIQRKGLNSLDAIVELENRGKNAN